MSWETDWEKACDEVEALKVEVARLQEENDLLVDTYKLYRKRAGAAEQEVRRLQEFERFCVDANARAEAAEQEVRNLHDDLKEAEGAVNDLMDKLDKTMKVVEAAQKWQYTPNIRTEKKIFYALREFDESQEKPNED